MSHGSAVRPGRVLPWPTSPVGCLSTPLAAGQRAWWGTRSSLFSAGFAVYPTWTTYPPCFPLLFLTLAYSLTLVSLWLTVPLSPITPYSPTHAYYAVYYYYYYYYIYR